ncbi:MAG: MmcQ/YjbR family DNA-binding protein [Nocardioidaceae bacterium]|nr:MmcQ/YjbR family DNA-binding protein [Nocardioidaceae bacterium]
MELEVDPEVVARLGAICAALPAVVEEDAWIGTRWRVRGRTFAHVLPIRDGRPPSYAQAAGVEGSAVVLTFRITEQERDLFTRLGPPYWAIRWGRDVGGLVLGDAPAAELDWTEIAELVTESYRLLAPKRLAAAVDFDPGAISGRMHR